MCSKGIYGFFRVAFCKPERYWHPFCNLKKLLLGGDLVQTSQYLDEAIYVTSLCSYIRRGIKVHFKKCTLDSTVFLQLTVVLAYSFVDSVSKPEATTWLSSVCRVFSDSSQYVFIIPLPCYNEKNVTHFGQRFVCRCQESAGFSTRNGYFVDDFSVFLFRVPKSIWQA